jgi:hypothetical protein
MNYISILACATESDLDTCLNSKCGQMQAGNVNDTNYFWAFSWLVK